MNVVEILKLIKTLVAKGKATKKEKSDILAAMAKLKSEDQELLADEAEKLADLEEGAESEEEAQAEVEKGIKALFAKEANSIKEEVKSFIEEQQKLASQKAGVYHKNVDTKRKALSESLRQIMKGLANNDDLKLKEMTTDPTGSPYAGYTVDSELSAEIRHLMTEYGVARREFTSIPLTKNSYRANDLATDVNVYWVDEGSAIASSHVVLGQEELSLEKLGAIVTFTSELLEDTEIDFVGFVGSRVAEKMAEAEDKAFFNGDGTGTYGGFTGLLQASDVNEVVMSGQTFASIDADDLLDMVDKTPAGALANAKYYLHRTIMSYIRKLKTDTTNEYIYQAPSLSGPATIWGYPVVTPEAMPTKTETAADTSFVLFGDLRKACIHGYKASGLKVSRFNSGVVRNVAANADINLITTDREAVRWTERTGYIRIVPKAVTKLTTAEASS